LEGEGADRQTQLEWKVEREREREDSTQPSCQKSMSPERGQSFTKLCYFPLFFTLALSLGLFFSLSAFVLLSFQPAKYEKGKERGCRMISDCIQ